MPSRACAAVTVGTLKGPSLSVYSKIAEVKVVPEFSVARIGEGGGSTPKVQGRFDAEAWGKGADGKPYRIGVFPAQWKVEAFDDRAKEDEDVKFAGTMQADTRRVHPGRCRAEPATQNVHQQCRQPQGDRRRRRCREIPDRRRPHDRHRATLEQSTHSMSWLTQTASDTFSE